MRLDFEMARWVRIMRLSSKAYSRMFGRLIGTYVFAVQPEVELARNFALRLADSLDIPLGAWAATSRVVSRMMDAQRNSTGIDTCLELPW